MSIFLQATLTTGEQPVGEFTKLRNVSRYIRQVFAGTKAFNVWTVESNTHPASGEPTLMRSRRQINGRHITAIVEVVPDADGGYRPVARPARGSYGFWTCPTPTPTGESASALVPGQVYPVHRDVTGHGERYVVALAGDATAPETRYFFARSAAPESVTLYASGPAALEGGVSAGRVEMDDDFDDDDDDFDEDADDE